MAHYERLKDADFNAATQYFERTKAFWDRVHTAWLDVYQRNRQVTLHEPADRENGPQAKLFDYADELGKGKPAAQNEAQMIEAALRDVGAPVQVSSAEKASAGSVAAAHCNGGGA